MGLNLDLVGKVLNCSADEDALTITRLNGDDKVIESLNRRKVGI